MHGLAAGSGNGGFDAFTRALAVITARAGLTLPRLADYEVRIPKGGRTDALTECTIVWSYTGINGQPAAGAHRPVEPHGFVADISPRRRHARLAVTGLEGVAPGRTRSGEPREVADLFLKFFVSF